MAAPVGIVTVFDPAPVDKSRPGTDPGPAGMLSRMIRRYAPARRADATPFPCSGARRVALALSVALLLALAAPAAGDARAEAGPTAPPEAPTRAETAQDLESLIATIEDKAEREKLLEQLRALLAARRAAEQAPAAEQPGVLGMLSAQVARIGGELATAVEVVLRAPKLLPWLRAQFRDPEARRRWLSGAGALLLALGLGLAAEFLAGGLLRRPRRAVEGRESDSAWLRLPFLSLRTVLDVLPIAAFAAAAYGALSLWEPVEQARLVTLALINASIVARVVMAAARMLLVPTATTLRVLPLRDDTANYLFVWTRRFATVCVYGYFAAEAARLLGLPPGAHAVAVQLLGIIVAAMTVVFVLQNRRGVADWMKPGAEAKGGALDSLRNRLADVWHVLAVAYVAGLYVVWALSVPGGFGYLLRATLLSLVIFVAALAGAGGVARLLKRIFAIADEVKAAYPGLEDRANRYLPVVHTSLRAFIYVVAALALLQAWGLDVFGWMAGDAGRALLARVATVVVVVVAALVFWEMLSAAVERYLERAARAASAQRSARLQTLLPLARKAMFVVLIVMVVLIGLSEFGVDITPLLAGAGVAGLAIGFGAQTLVKDVITGLFILVEDSVAVGDIVSVAGHTGIVEALSIRSIRLRGYDGTVHTVPFSEVSTVENLTKEFSYYVFEMGVAYRENVDEVIELMRQVGAEMQEDPDFGPLILEPLDVAGLDQFGDSAVVIKARFKTQPLSQWAVGREFNRRLKALFDAKGIEIPFPHTTIYFGEDKEGRAPPAHVQVAGGKDRPAPGGGAGDKGGKKAPPAKADQLAGPPDDD